MDPITQPKPRILHIDDFDDFLDEFRVRFSEHFDITSVQSGSDGLETLAQEPLDAVVLDYDMPDMNGLDFLVEAYFGRPRSRAPHTRRGPRSGWSTDCAR